MPAIFVANRAGTRLYARHAETLKEIPTPELPSPVNNQYCTNSDAQPGSAADTGCHNCNAFAGAGGNASYASIWGGNCANQVRQQCRRQTARSRFPFRVRLV